MAIERMNHAVVSYSTSAEKSETKTDSETSVASEATASTEKVVPKKKEAEAESQSAETTDQNSLTGSASNAQIKKAVEEINKKAHNSEAIFGIHDKTNRVMIKIIDKDSKEVLKEYPPEKTLDMIAKVWEVAGLLVDEKL